MGRVRDRSVTSVVWVCAIARSYLSRVSVCGLGGATFGSIGAVAQRVHRRLPWLADLQVRGVRARSVQVGRGVAALLRHRKQATKGRRGQPKGEERT